MSKAANMTALEELHAEVTKQLTDLVKQGDMKAIAEAIKMLKNNGVEPARDVENSAIRKLSEQIAAINASGDPDALDQLLQ